MHHNRLSAALALALTLGAGSAFAQAQQPAAKPAAPAAARPAGPSLLGQPISIAVVDLQQVLRDSSARKGIESQLEKQRQALVAEVGKQEDQLRASGQELERQRATLTPEQFTQKRQEFERKVAQTQTLVQTRRRALDKATETAMQSVVATINGIAVDISKERNVQMVVTKAAVVSYDDSLDITAEVVRRLNAKLPAVNVVVPKS